ncbi:MAG: NUDIX hydrolase [Myxococcaceae bacterium]|jgi:ADP-ribose pyrophosphatase YjhB (NUDIX family)|nr:NUDIX hydrolase [Myxococcaceae bacterium]MCA3011167.1 NUDIX hydrolase [Myxococcaceae bacterium]
MRWLEWVQTLTTVSQRGLAYSKDPYDRENYELVRALCAEMIALGSGAPLTDTLSALTNQTGYPTPRVDVRAAVAHDGRVLLVKETQDGRWALPGGWADLGVSPAEMAAKEVREEAGYEVRASRLLGVFGKKLDPKSVFSVYKLVFLCERVGGEARVGHETSAVGFFARDALPQLSLHRTHPRHLEAVFARLDDPTLPPFFE